MPALINHEDIDSLFSYHKVDADGILRINHFRERYKILAHDIMNAVPASPERTLVIRKLHDSMMQLNVVISSEYPTE